MRAWILVVIGCLPAFAQTRSAARGLEPVFREVVAAQAAPAWIAYTVPGTQTHDRSCCCPGGTLHLEGSSELDVLFRVERGKIVRIRAARDECALDTGGLPLVRLTDVRPTESIALLQGFLESGEQRLADSAVAAIALHADRAADGVLIAAARSNASARVRGTALFWLAQRAGDKAAGVITEAIANDPETDVKRRAVFALSLLPRGEGVPLLIQVARTNANPAVRKQAVFWLGQSRDPRALEFFEEVLR